MRPAFRRGSEGEGKPKSMPWRGPADVQRPPHGGVYFGLGNERAKPLAFPRNKQMEAISRPQPLCGTNKGTLAQNDASRTFCARTCGPAGVRQGEWQERQRVSSKTPRHQERDSSGTERVLQPSRSLSLAPDRHPNGPGLQARFAPADRPGCPQGQRLRFAIQLGSKASIIGHRPSPPSAHSFAKRRSDFRADWSPAILSSISAMRLFASSRARARSSVASKASSSPISASVNPPACAARMKRKRLRSVWS
jgi:hypothetical protein